MWGKRERIAKQAPEVGNRAISALASRRENLAVLGDRGGISALVDVMRARRDAASLEQGCPPCSTHFPNSVSLSVTDFDKRRKMRVFSLS